MGISYRLEQWMSFPACSCIAPTSAGWPCPREFVAIPPIKSRYRLPSLSKSQLPSPPVALSSDVCRSPSLLACRDSFGYESSNTLASYSSLERTFPIAVEDPGLHPAACGLGRGTQLGHHPARSEPALDVSLAPVWGERLHRLAFLQQPVHVGEHEQVSGPESDSERRRDRVGIDVVRAFWT